MPDPVHGKICYLEIPATDVERSAQFYRDVFGWNIRQRANGGLAFDDPTGAVSGSWVLKRQPSTAPGLLFYIMVDSVAKAANAVMAQRPRLPRVSRTPRAMWWAFTRNRKRRTEGRGQLLPAQQGHHHCWRHFGFRIWNNLKFPDFLTFSAGDEFFH
jgi:hypothetical protein